MRYWLIMPAAGSGRRFGAASPKQYAPLEGGTVIEWALAPFLEDSRCAGIVVAVAPGDSQWLPIGARLAGPAATGPAATGPGVTGSASTGSGRAVPRVRAVEGGDSRSRSVRCALAALEGCAMPADWVLVHDAARPCLAAEDLERLLASVQSHAVGGLLATPAADTLKRAACVPAAPTGAGAAVTETVDRSALWRALTPQMFRYGGLCAALDAAHAAGRSPTDEAQALEWQGREALLVPGAASNLKITTPDDLLLAGAILRARHGATGQRMQMRIGSGFDVHAFGPGEFVMLGGVRIPHARGVIAHSDGDVVLHALCDALLGAAGLGDIGQHFPDTDPRWRAADSRHFVTEVLARLRERALEVVNVDVTVLAQSPKVGPHREVMRAGIAALLGILPERVNIKATTTEGLGFLGRAEGLAAQAIVLLAASAPCPPRS